MSRSTSSSPGPRRATRSSSSAPTAPPSPPSEAPCRGPPRACEWWGAGGPSTAAGDRGQHLDDAAVPHLRGQPLLEPDVLAVDVDVDEPAHLPGLVTDAAPQQRVP